MSEPRITDYDPDWPILAEAWLSRIAGATTPLSGSREFSFQHIGSTAVPGLAAKAILDLQMLAPTLPEREALTEALAPLGLVPATGSRPDSPGVYADIPRPGADPDPRLYRKLLFHRPDEPPAIILHVRRTDSPFAAFVLAFRDWLRAGNEHRREYETLKRELAAKHAGDADYDDYTRAKTAFFDRIQPELGLG